jgi:hypothetical protein
MDLVKLSAGKCPVFPATFVEEAVFSPSFIFGSSIPLVFISEKLVYFAQF